MDVTVKRMKARDARLKRVYGISQAIYEEILAKQDGKCWICRRPPKPGKSFDIDHTHEKGGGGPVRGLLCFFCNKYIIGRIKDPALLDAGAAYLRQHTGYFTPLHKKRKKKRKKK